jgi:PAS domain S-box-containing protein
MHDQRSPLDSIIPTDENRERSLFCCLIYRQDSERDKEIARYLTAGLEGQEQAIVVISGSLQEALYAGLKNQGFDATEAEQHGRRIFISPESLGLVTAPSVSDAVDSLAAVGRKAEAQGFSGARIYWEMSGAMLEKDLSWLQECLVGCGRLAASTGISLLCGYDRQQVTSSLLVETLRLYPQLIHRGQRLPNRYYLPTDAKGIPSSAGMFGGSAENSGILHEKRSKRSYRRGEVMEAIFKAAPIGLWMLNKNQRMVFANQTFCDAAGVSEEQLLRAPHYSEIIHAGEAIECMLSDAEAFNADGPVESEELITSADGSQHICRVVKTKVVNSEQDIEGLLGLAIDITEHKEAERRLRHSEARFRDIALSMADFIWEVDASGCFIYCSDKVEEMLGFTAQELLGKCFFELIAGREAKGLESLLCGSVAPRTAFRNIQSWALDKEGQRHCLRISGVPIFAEDGIYLGFRGVTEDVTVHKQAEAGMQRALAQAEQARDQIDNIIKSTADGLIVTDPRSHQIVLINDSAREFLKCEVQDPVGQPVASVLQDEGLLQQIQAIYAHHAPPLLHTDISLPRSTTAEACILQARTSLMRNKQGRVSGAITALRDVTRERELDRMKAEFMSMAAHELRTPLTAILGYSELCMNPEEFGGFSAAQQKEFMAEINSKAEVLAKLVNDLLDISRLDAGKQLPLNIEEVAIAPMLSKLVKHYRMLAPKHLFEVALAENLPESVQADPDKLEQVLENLFSNAVKYSPEGSLIRVCGERIDGHCQITVVDQGIGMTSDQGDHVFDKFYRADYSDTAAKGIGLGMSIARQIVEQHGGSIWVESSTGVGTRVVFTVPIKN